MRFDISAIMDDESIDRFEMVIATTLFEFYDAGEIDVKVERGDEPDWSKFATSVEVRTEPKKETKQ